MLPSFLAGAQNILNHAPLRLRSGMGFGFAARRSGFAGQAKWGDIFHIYSPDFITRKITFSASLLAPMTEIVDLGFLSHHITKISRAKSSPISSTPEKSGSNEVVLLNLHINFCARSLERGQIDPTISVTRNCNLLFVTFIFAWQGLSFLWVISRLHSAYSRRHHNCQSW